MRRLVLSGVLLIGLAGSVQTAGRVELTIRNGQVWLVARDATFAQIAAEWARLEGTKFENADRVPGGLLNLDLIDVREQDALEILLRSAAGFLTFLRPADGSHQSRLDRVLVMPRSLPPPATATRGVQPLPPTLPEPAIVPVIVMPGVERRLGPDGRPVPDDQEDAPPAAPPSTRGP